MNRRLHRQPILLLITNVCLFSSLACLCAEKAREKGYGAFGLQFYGECWGGVNGSETYSMFGPAPSTKCVMDYAYTENNEPNGWKYCDISSEQECVGVQRTNYVYILDEGMSLWLIVNKDIISLKFSTIIYAEISNRLRSATFLILFSCV